MMNEWDSRMAVTILSPLHLRRLLSSRPVLTVLLDTLIIIQTAICDQILDDGVLIIY